jgi:hypothetical protein
LFVIYPNLIPYFMEIVCKTFLISPRSPRTLVFSIREVFGFDEVEVLAERLMVKLATTINIMEILIT